jgi:hypothetical protein
MTNLDALQSIAPNNYPFNPNLYLKVITDSGLNTGDTYTSDNEQLIDLCLAGILITAISNVDVAEGGYKITNADRQSMITVINGIYSKYGMPLFTAGGVLNNASYKW